MPELRLVSAGPTEDQLIVHRIPSPMTHYGGAEEYREIFSTIKGKSRRAGVLPSRCITRRRNARKGTRLRDSRGLAGVTTRNSERYTAFFALPPERRTQNSELIAGLGCRVSVSAACVRHGAPAT